LPRRKDFIAKIRQTLEIRKIDKVKPLSPQQTQEILIAAQPAQIKAIK
jgi:hypothetical protein